MKVFHSLGMTRLFFTTLRGVTSLSSSLSPPYLMASAHITESIPGAFESLRIWIATSPSVQVYSPVLIGISTSIGGMSTVEETGGVLRSFAKYFLHSPIRSCFELITSPLGALNLEAGLNLTINFPHPFGSILSVC